MWIAIAAMVAAWPLSQLANVVVVIPFVVLRLHSGESLQQAAEGIVSSFPAVATMILAGGAVLAGIAFGTTALSRVRPAEGLGFRKTKPLAVLVGALGIVGLGPTSEVLALVMRQIAPGFTFGALDSLQEMATSAPWYAVLPFFALVPGFSEELLFRGLVQQSIRRPVWAIVASGLLFALYHADPHHVVAVAPLGLYLAWIGYRADSIWVPIAAHVTNNAIAVLGSAFLVGSSAEPQLDANIGIVALIGLVWTAACAALLVRFTPPPRTL